MQNAKEEFLDIIAKHPSPVKCAYVLYDSYKDYVKRRAHLPIGFTNDQLQQFIQNIDYEYDNGFGHQQLFGNIWFDDGTWADRREYDGSEWWEIQRAPTIPLECSSVSVPQIGNDEIKRIEC